MTQTEVLLAILGVLIGVNVLLIGSIPSRSRRRRRSLGEVRVQPVPPAGRAGLGDPRATDDARAAAAIEAFVAGVSDDASGRGRTPPPAWTATLPERPAVADSAANLAVPAPRNTSGPAQPSISPEAAASGPVDPATWSRTIREESARVARFGHPVTVVIAEVPHLDALADRFGRGVSDRVTTEAARLFVSEGRASDRVARLGDARFGVLLRETAEVAAGDYVERVRAAIDGWLESTGLSTRLALGWASPAEGGDVSSAAVEAEQRMHAVSHR